MPQHCVDGIAPPLNYSAVTTARQVLLLGLASADWSLLRPLIESGRLPFLAKVIETGATGQLRSLQPQFEPLLWTSAATGRRADSHGVLQIHESNHAHQRTPLSSLSRRIPALWNLCSHTGRATLMVNWPVSFPAEPIRGAVVSDAFFRLAGTPDQLQAVPQAAVFPHDLQEQLLDLRLAPSKLRREELAFFAEPIDNDTLTARLAVSLAEQLSVHGVLMELSDKQSWPLIMARYDLLNALGPDFMACHPPQLGWIPDDAFARFGQVIERAAIYLDYQLGNLLQTLGDQTTIILFSERGLMADSQRPASAALARQRGGQPWYSNQGIVVLSGPGVASDGTVQGASLLDIAPTVLHLLGQALPDGLEGRVLAEALEDQEPSINASGPLPTLESSGGHSSARKLSGEEQRWLAARWRETGLDPSYKQSQNDPEVSSGPEAESNIDHSPEQIENDRQFALAMVHLDANQPKRALRVLESLHRRLPDDDRVRIHLARCRHACGDLVGARTLLEAVVSHPQVRPYELMALARIQLAEGNPDAALGSLFRAEQSEGERPTVHCRIGQVYLKLDRLDDAERGFAKALERDSAHAEAQLGMARVLLARGEVDRAVDHALNAVECNRQLAAGHYWLGRALVAAGRPDSAAAAFETLLQLRPGFVTARKELADVLERLGRNNEARQHREHVRTLEQHARMTASTRELMGQKRSS